MNAGLADKWREVIDALSQVIPFYDDMNRLISLGGDMKLRRDGLKATLQPDDFMLDAGCGPGVMSVLAEGLMSSLRGVVLCDALKPMLLEARGRLSLNPAGLVNGLFENLPFREESFDVAACGFSLRDAYDLSIALDEIKRVLKPDGGRLLVIDILKPDHPVARLTGWLYWRIIVPSLALIKLGRKGLLYSAISTTYQSLPAEKTLIAVLKRRFRKVSFTRRMKGFAIIVVAER